MCDRTGCSSGILCRSSSVARHQKGVFLCCTAWVIFLPQVLVGNIATRMFFVPQTFYGSFAMWMMMIWGYYMFELLLQIELSLVCAPLFGGGECPPSCMFLFSAVVDVPLKGPGVGDFRAQNFRLALGVATTLSLLWEAYTTPTDNLSLPVFFYSALALTVGLIA